jgi:diguanylate cyclase (GGDEF)-like protein
VTYDGAVQSPDEPQPSFIQKIIGGIVAFLNSLTIRLILIFVLGTAVVAFAADIMYPKVLGSYANQLVVELAGPLKDKPLAPNTVLPIINQHNLAWYYTTTADGKVMPASKPYAPDLPKYDITSRELTWRNKPYYEAVSQIGDGRILHIGYSLSPVFAPLLQDYKKFFTMGTTLGYVSIVLFGLFIVCTTLLTLWVGQPLRKLARACYSLLLSRDAYSHLTGGGVSVPGACSEVQLVGLGLKEIRRQYDQANAGRIAKEEEIKRQRTEHAEEKQLISQQYEDQIEQTNQRLTELHTKEQEEEFLNLLGRELDNLKSVKQIAQRVLEKLNDKYPTTFIYGVFFGTDKHYQVRRLGVHGFDDRSLLLLEKVDHQSIARQVLSSGQRLEVGFNMLRDYGLQELAQKNPIKTVVYVPVRFQNLDLGMLAFYFVQEGQTVQDRLRVVRNVAELAARSMHQAQLLEEEQQSARRDPLTGLHNKKYYYEIMPRVFEQASLKPEENPVSIIMMDGDHFKSINDTYGHQIGDEMLKALSKTILTCIRTEDSVRASNLPGDHLMRFGGEEFLVIMEKAPKDIAMMVAERIREAVANKTDWPGGIPKWTISLGVATYPYDARKPDELMQKADNALYYVKEELGRNKVCHAQDVPRTYKSKKKAAEMRGELGVFDGAGLLQSIASSQKTGILNIKSQDGGHLWMLFENGKAVQARMGKMMGNAAVTEFLVTFEDGDFQFQEIVQTSSSSKLPTLDPSFNVNGSLDRCLMDGALAQDNYNAARDVISTLDLFIRPVPQDDFMNKWKGLATLEDPPSEAELTVMKAIVQKADGRSTLAKIFKEIDPQPTHLKWRSAALLIQYKLIESRPAVAAKT